MIGSPGNDRRASLERRAGATRGISPDALARGCGLALAAFLLLHVWETSSAIAGREAYLARPLAAVPSWARAALLAPLVFSHLRLLGARRAADDAARYPDVGVRKLQWLAGVVVLAFLVVHLGHALVPALLGGDVEAYERLRLDLAQPAYVGIYVVGIAAASLHFAQGLEAASGDIAARFGENRAAAARAVGLAAGVALFAVAINTLSHFAAGRALVAPDGSP